MSRYIGRPQATARETDAYLRVAGRARSECFVLWSGVQENNTFRIRTGHLPRQTAYRLADGLCVRVEGDELHRLNAWLFEHGESLAVQVIGTGLRLTTRRQMIPTQLSPCEAALSLVVPDFGRAGLLGNGVAYYRLGLSGWDDLSLGEAKKLIQLGD